MATEIYTVICAILGETTSFPVKIANNERVDRLKEKIKEESPNRFASVDANELALYRVEIFGSRNAMREELKKMACDFGQREELDPLDELTKIYSTAPPEGTIHIIVQPPKFDEELKPQKPTDPESVNHADAVRFFTETLDIYTVADLRDDSNNTHLHKGAHVASSPFPNETSFPDNHQTPSFVSVFLGKLDEKRPASQAQLQQLLQIFAQATCEDHFKAPAPEEQEMSSIELDTYTKSLRFHHHPLNTIRNCSSTFKAGHVTVHLVDPALLAADEAWCYDKKVGCDPLLLQGTIANREPLYTLKPRNDFCLFEATYGPLIMGEIVSEDTESDRWRMLFEGVAICRHQNIIRKDREAIILCFYLNKYYKMEHYLVYQAADTDVRDVHVLHDLTLDLAEVQDTFILSKQLFNFREHLLRIPKTGESRREEVLRIQDKIQRFYHMSLAAAGRVKSEASSASRAPARTLGPINGDAVLRASFNAIHVLTHNQKDVAAAIRRSDMQSVVLKRVRTNSSELRILRLLQSHALRGSSHIIPLLDVVERTPNISTLVMPYYTPILDLETGKAEQLALQLIRGVDWLHKQLISHSDIKETNLVFDERQNCLFIIDFGLAIKLTCREQKVQGARGTVEHVAPDVGITSSWENYLQEVFLDEESIYSPMLADVWAVGDAINHFQERFRSSTESIQTVVERVAKELQAVEPIKRLSLHEAERRIAAESSMLAMAPGPPATSH